MYQSNPNLTIPGQTPREFFERAKFPPRGTKKVQNPDSWGRKIMLKPHTGAIFVKNLENKHKA